MRVNRSVAMAGKYFGGTVRRPKETGAGPDAELCAAAAEVTARAIANAILFSLDA